MPSQPNYDVPAISLTPSSGYATAPFKITGQFFAVGDKTRQHLHERRVEDVPRHLDGRLQRAHVLMTKVPSKAKPGTATVTSTGSSGNGLSAVQRAFAVTSPAQDEAAASPGAASSVRWGCQIAAQAGRRLPRTDLGLRVRARGGR